MKRVLATYLSLLICLYSAKNVCGGPRLLDDFILEYGSYLSHLFGGSHWSESSEQLPLQITVNSASNFTNVNNPNGQCIYPIWGRYNIWDPSLTPAGRVSPKYDFLEEGILMTATGGRSGYDEMFNANGPGLHDFSRLDEAIDRLLNDEIIPTIVIGNVPDAISNRPGDFGRFDANIGAPADYNSWVQHHDYIEELCAHLMANYGGHHIPPTSWEYRLMTEPDNVSWWDPYNMGTGSNCHSHNLNQYMRLYDETADAIHSGLGDNSVPLNPGNLMVTPFLERELSSWASDLSYMMAQDGRIIDRFCMSLYAGIIGDGTEYLGGHQMNGDPRSVKKFVNSMRTAIASDFPWAKISIEEGGLYLDENRRKFGEVGCSSLGAAFLGAMYKSSYDVKLDRLTQWSLTSNGIKSPAYNVVEMYSRMRGQRRLEMVIPETDYPYVDGISSKSPMVVRSIVYSYAPAHNADNKASVSLRFVGLKKNWRYNVKVYLVDETHSNYTDEFYADLGVSSRQDIRTLMTEAGANEYSEYHSDFERCLNAGARQTWQNNLNTYRGKDDLERIENKRRKTDQYGRLTEEFEIKANSVYLFEIYNSALSTLL